MKLKPTRQTPGGLVTEIMHRTDWQLDTGALLMVIAFIERYDLENIRNYKSSVIIRDLKKQLDNHIVLHNLIPTGWIRVWYIIPIPARWIFRQAVNALIHLWVNNNGSWIHPLDLLPKDEFDVLPDGTAEPGKDRTEPSDVLDPA